MRIETIRANGIHIVQTNTSGVANEYSENVLRVKLNSVKDKFGNIDDEKITVQNSQFSQRKTF